MASSQDELLSLLDLLDLDEEIIDSRLKSIMVRSNYTNKHLKNALQLLRYKYLINIQEETECDNTEEFNFAAKLIKEITDDSVDIVCEITNTVMQLKNSKLVSYSEHILVQILGNLDLTAVSKSSDENERSKILLYLKVCDSVLDATIQQGEKISMLFLETPLEEILGSRDEQLKIHFIMNSVQKIVEGIDGYDILTRIWSYLEHLRGDDIGTTLKVLSSLSDYYLPVNTGDREAKYESSLVYSCRFWDVVLYGLMSADPSLRKISVYLAKRAIDYVTSLRVNFNLKSNGTTLFSWDNRKCDLYRNQWDSFFILMDSLEEKQSNIVLPSLQLFDTFTEISHSWLNCAYNLGLKHDNGQVRLKCIEYRIKTNINSNLEAKVLLEALNDINFYENPIDCKALKNKLSNMFKCGNNLMYVLNAIPHAHLSPVPFYHLSEILADINIAVDLSKDFKVCAVIIDILKASCNIITIREAIHFNIAQFVRKSCNNLHWKEIASIYSLVQSEMWTERKASNPILTLLSGWNFSETDKINFYKYVTESHLNTDLGILYLENHLEDVNIFVEIINEKIKNIQDIINRQYSNKLECFDDVQYILNLQIKSCEIEKFLPKANKIILRYMYCLLSEDSTLNIEENRSLFNNISFNVEQDLRDTILELNRASIMFIQCPGTNLEKIVQSLLILNFLYQDDYFIDNFGHETIEFKYLLDLVATVDKRNIQNTQSAGRWLNTFYETHCKLLYLYIDKFDRRIIPQIHSIDNSEDAEKLKTFVDYIEKVTDCGGYGCLEWILKIINEILQTLTNSHYNLSELIRRMWSEVEELKSSNQYLPCMLGFIKLITHSALIEKPEFNNIVILYCTKIIDFGFINNSPLYFLIDNEQLSVFIDNENTNELNEYGHLVCILSEILLFCPVPRKDQRIADNLALEILKTSGEGCDSTEMRFNFAIQYKAVQTLSKVNNTAVLLALTNFITRKIDIIFKAKLRYHGNSQVHRTFQTALQHLLYILYLKSNDKDVYYVSNWSIDLLGRLPHQMSVRICLEWHIALDFYVKKANLDAKLLRSLKSKSVPLTSQFAIIYWLLKSKIARKSHTEKEFEFVMDTLLSHTMGQMFNIRLLAQYLATKLYKIHSDNPKYEYIVKVIDKTLDDNSNDKNFVKLKGDYFMNDFDIISNLTPLFIYHTLPRLCDVCINEAVDTKYILGKMEEINRNTEKYMNSVLEEEWLKNRIRDEEFVDVEMNRYVDKKIQEDVEALRTIQKKYIPWKNMSDINVYNFEKKRETPSNLVVVASLIDKLPNLGGMARTCEVFGVKTYVVDSLRHLQDKQFQGLSVSAERWIDVEEVRPGQPLKDYLNRKKAEGYSVVAAEQTSTSSKLQAFRFPKKTLLLLGHEKEGIPCDLLPMMDHCVEIPQQGFVRSLNVHVTAAIFVWEYSRQNLL